MQCWENVADDVRFYQEIDEELFKKYISKDDKVLDFGCGYGRTLSKLKEIGYKNLEGIDFSKKMIERAERETKDIKYIVWDSESKLNKNCYDVIILIFVFASVYTDEEQDKILVELKSALKPDGIIFMCDALLGEDERNIARYKEFFDKYGVYGTFETDNGMIARHLDYTRLEEIKNRFENINYKEQVIKTQNGNSVRSFTFIGRNKK
ncbi:MAG: hypothetical protein A2Y18_00660 [Clostridiales bacterium GWD2_32_19]|nr:MAG: hypothetical protein A2Y18_00660 [Clostridiales bacterium GWD2_32_19]